MTLMVEYTSGIKAIKYFAIFFVLVLLLANFSYAASRGGSDSNSYKTLDFKLMKQAHDSWKLKSADTIKKLWDYITSFSKKTDSLAFTTDTFDVNLAKYIKNPGNNQIELKIKSLPQHMACTISGKNLNCNVEDGFVGLDSLSVELTDLIWKIKSTLTLNFSLDNKIEEVILPTFNQGIVAKTFPEDSCPIIDLDDYVSNPQSLSYTAEITKPLANGTSNIVQETKKFNCSPKENFNGTDSTTVKIKESGSELQFNFNITPVNDAPVLDNLQLAGGYVSMSVFDGSSTTLHLLDYLIDPDIEKNYSFTLGSIPALASCSLNGSDLICSGKANGEGSFKVTVKDGIYLLDIPVKVTVTNVNTQPKLDTTKLTNNKILLTVNDGIQTKINLNDYVIDPDAVKNYTFDFVSSPTLANCNLVNSELLCSGKSEGEEDFAIKLTDMQFTLNLPIHLNVINITKPPVYNNNFTDLGITVFSGAPSFNIQLQNYFTDPDTQNLTYGFDKVAGNAVLNCSSTSTGLSCTVSSPSNYIDVKFWASDGKFKATIPSAYRIAIVKPEDFLAVITGPQKVLANEPFDMTYSVKNNLGFDLYNMPITTQKDNSLIATKFYLDNGSLDGETIAVNLKSQESKTKTLQVTTPANATVQTYNIWPRLDGKYDIFVPVVLTSVPYDAQFLKDYLSVVGYTPGKNISGHDERLPGFIWAHPYKIYNTLDVPVDLYVCYAAVKTVADSTFELYKKSGASYLEIPENYYCDNTKVNVGTTEINLYTKPDNSGMIHSLLVSTIIITPPSIMQSLFFGYIKTNNKIITYTQEIFTLDIKYQTEYTESKILSPSSGTTLSKNTEYDLSVQFSNGYAYSLVDVDGCVKTAYMTDPNNPQTTTAYGLENEVYSIVGNNCAKVDMKYYLPEKPDDSKTNVTFKFKTKFKTYDNITLPYYLLSTGFLLDTNYINKVWQGYPVK